MGISKSAQAIAWLLEDTTRKPVEAAKMFGIAKNTLSAAMKLRNEYGCCPTCGQSLREGDAPGVKSKSAPAEA